MPRTRRVYGTYASETGGLARKSGGACAWSRPCAQAVPPLFTFSLITMVFYHYLQVRGMGSAKQATARWPGSGSTHAWVRGSRAGEIIVPTKIVALPATATVVVSGQG